MKNRKDKIIVTIIPFVLIIIILAVTLAINSCQNNEVTQDNKQIQENIKEYADNKNLQDNVVIERQTPMPQQTETDENEKKDLIPTPTPYSEVDDVIDYSQISFHAESHLGEMMSYWADNNKDALNDLVHLNHFKAMSYSLKGTDDFYYYGETAADGKPNGKGIAVYFDNQYYYGDWKDGVRSGIGTWMHYHIHEKENTTDLYTYHQYVGSWANDLPCGEGSEHYEYNTKLFKPNVGYNTNLIGSYMDGLVHGEFYLTNIYSDGNVKEWTANGFEGSWIYCADSVDTEGRLPVQVDMADDENYIWLHPDDNIDVGVCCIISKNKN